MKSIKKYFNEHMIKCNKKDLQDIIVDMFIAGKYIRFENKESFVNIYKQSNKNDLLFYINKNNTRSYYLAVSFNMNKNIEGFNENKLFLNYINEILKDHNINYKKYQNKLKDFIYDDEILSTSCPY